MCIVGRRERTRGLFLDRRAFLTSYDPDAGRRRATPILTRILAAVVPVCAGINLRVLLLATSIRPGWGCGTKLPHNVTSLLGVMDGAASDLRTGLPWQMVEIHEPVRLLFVIETTPEAMLSDHGAQSDGSGAILRNDWVQLAVLDPQSAEIQRVSATASFTSTEPERDRAARARRRRPIGIAAGAITWSSPDRALS